MLDVVPDCYRRLGLLPGADTRDIRRAYARELKQIDPAIDAAAFQALRGAYETALQFAQRQDEGGAAGTAQISAAPTSPQVLNATVPPVEMFQQPAPDQQADAIVDDFCKALAGLTVQRGGASNASCQQALRAALADERLSGIEARQIFELRVAGMLAQGWHYPCCARSRRRMTCKCCNTSGILRACIRAFRTGCPLWPRRSVSPVGSSAFRMARRCRAGRVSPGSPSAS